VLTALLRFLGLSETGDPQSYRHGDAMTVLGPDLTVKGDVQGTGGLRLLGRFEGEIHVRGTVHVGPDARVDANITATSIVVEGIVRGNLAADGSIDILPTGALTGTVKSGGFAAAGGSTVKGEVWVEPSVAPEEPR
jgi:cytoskeletal protein CcmA (bactofilin family)